MNKVLLKEDLIEIRENSIKDFNQLGIESNEVVINYELVEGDDEFWDISNFLLPHASNKLTVIPPENSIITFYKPLFLQKEKILFADFQITKIKYSNNYHVSRGYLVSVSWVVIYVVRVGDFNITDN